MGDNEMTGGSSPGAVRFEILGPVRAYRGTEKVDLGSPRQQAVLALLLLHAGRPVPLPQMVAALWNGDPPENAADVVLRCVGALRRALDPQRTSLLALTERGYVLRADEHAVDAGRLRATLAQARSEHRTGGAGTATEDIRRAMASWQGEPLAGLTGPVFESARHRLNEERATASALLAGPETAPPQPGPTPATPLSRPTPAPPHPGPTPSPPHPGPTQAPPPPTRVESMTMPPTRVETVRTDPSYPEAVDPWAGHDLFPPDPLSMT